MLEGRLETLHCGTNCFAVYGKEEILADFIEFVQRKALQPIDIRIIAGVDSLGRTKIIITGNMNDNTSFETYHLDILHNYTLIDKI